MELYVMQYVLAVADCGNFSQAAELCHVGQPALSQQIAKLERELGLSLFRRHARGAELTQAGEAFVLRAREILQRTQSLQAEMSLYAGLQRGSLNLGIITSLQCIDFGGLLSAFCGSYPNISVNITQGGTHALLKLLQNRRLDLAFLNLPPTGIPSDLEFAQLGSDRYCLAVPSLHPLAKRGQVSLRELSGERFIFHESTQVAAQLCLNACREAGFEPNIVCRSSSPSTGLYMVRGGLGVALLPSEEFRTHVLDGVVELNVTEPIIKQVGIAWRKDSASPLVNTLVQFALSFVR